MTQFPTPTRADHQRFCELEGWLLVRDARGAAVTHHRTYELALPDGRILRTRISLPLDRTDYGPGLWSHILRDQLDVTPETFWSCVREGVVPLRGAPRFEAEPVPAALIYQLVVKYGVSEAEVARMTRVEVLAALEQHWSAPESK